MPAAKLVVTRNSFAHVSYTHLILSILLLIPGIVAGLTLSSLCFGRITLAAALLFDILANLILSGLIFAACQDILHRVDITAVH